MCNGLGDYLNMCGGACSSALGMLNTQAPQSIYPYQSQLANCKPDVFAQLIAAQYQQYKPKKLPPLPPRACPLHWRKPEDRP
jgi:hypothetical protein